MNIASYTYDEFLQKVRAFHGNTSPGVVLGGIMVAKAQNSLPKEGLFDAICETDRCLPDAIQLLTPCTIGNGWMRIINTGRFAVSLYDKHTGEGVRVFVDQAKLHAFTEIEKWFNCLAPNKEQSKDRLLEEIKISGGNILGACNVKIDINSLPNPIECRYPICAKCGESYLPSDQGVCLGCQGKAYISVASTKD